MAFESDIDLLIVIPDGIDKVSTAWAIYSKMTDLGIGVDLILVYETELNSKKDDKNLIFKSALQEGREIYAA